VICSTHGAALLVEGNKQYNVGTHLKNTNKDRNNTKILDTSVEIKLALPSFKIIFLFQVISKMQ